MTKAINVILILLGIVVLITITSQEQKVIEYMVEKRFGLQGSFDGHSYYADAEKNDDYEDENQSVEIVENQS